MNKQLLLDTSAVIKNT